MKSQEALEAELKDNPQGHEKSCADFNKLTLNWALDHVTEAQRQRYKSEGIALELGEDRKVVSGAGWLPAGLKIEMESGKAVIHSPTLRTGLNFPESFAGMTYCKLMPASWAVEWVLVNSFRRKDLLPKSETLKVKL